MKKLITTIITILLLSSANTIAEIDCTQFDKLTAKYLECTAKNAKKKIIKKTELQKKKFNKSDFKKKLVKFKNSKTLKDFVEKK